MNKQQFMEFSLSSGLKIYMENLDGTIALPWKLTYESIRFAIDNGNMPILHPLSDRTKEIEHNGEKFVPIVELARIATNSNYEDWRVVDNMAVHSDDLYNFSIAPNCDMMLKKTFGWKDFDICSSQMLLFQKLIEWHFNLMDKSEPFIPVTEEFNPYK